MTNREYNEIGYGKNNDAAFVDFYVRAAERRGVDVAKINVLRESYKRKGRNVECHAVYFVQGEEDLIKEGTTKPPKNQGNETKDNATLTARVRSEENEPISAGDLVRQLNELVNEWDAEEKD